MSHCAKPSLFCLSLFRAAAKAVSLRFLQQLAPSLYCVCSSFYSCHILFAFVTRKEATLRSVTDRKFATPLSLHLLAAGLFCIEMAATSFSGYQLTLFGHSDSLCVRLVCLHLFVFASFCLPVLAR